MTKTVKTVWVDFNARTERDDVRLTTVGSKRSLQENPVELGEWVWISDDELRVKAQVCEEDRLLIARPAWKTLEMKGVEGWTSVS